MTDRIVINTDDQSPNTPPQDRVPITALSLPPELRLRIYEAIFNAKDCWLWFNIGDQVFLVRSTGNAGRHPLSFLARANRLVSREIMSYMYGQANADIIVHDRTPPLWVSGRCIGTVEEVLIWPYLRKLILHLSFTRGGDSHILAQNLSQLILGLENGKQLNSLTVRLIWYATEPIPPGMEEVIEELRRFELKGSLTVIIDGDLEEFEREEMERDIHRAIVGRAES